MNSKVFTQESISELETAMKNTKSVRMYKRYFVVLIHFQGLSNKTIAQIECLEEHTVRNYIKNYKNKGLDGLVINKSSGCPRKLTSEQEKNLVDVITNKVGLNSRKNPTIKLAQDLVLKNFKIAIKHIKLELYSSYICSCQSR